MQKKDIAQRIHQEAEIPEKDAATLLDWILDLVKTTLQQGESISISKFGSFTVRRKAPRKGRNPQTGEELMISPRRVVTFRASPQLKIAVNAVPAERRDVKGLPAEGEVTSLPSAYVLKELEE
jgi:integration host factor subunit alpha